MFLKIYKHSFLAPLKTLIPLIIIHLCEGIIGGVSARVLPAFEENVMLYTMFTTLSSLSTMAISVLAFVEIIIVFSSFRKAVSTDEAYLTYTLPATAGQQLGARTLSIATWYVITTAITYVSLAVFMALSGGSPIFEMTGGIELGEDFSMFTVELVILVIVINASVLVHVIFGILLSQKFATKTKTKSANALTALIGFAEAFLLVFIFIMVMVGLLTSENIANVEVSLHIIIWFFIALFSALGGLCYFLSYKLMSRWLNLA